jgi:hypothetical protein
MLEELQNRHCDILLAERDGEITGMLPLFDCDSIFLGKISVSMPFAVYGGVVADDEESALLLLREAAKRSRGRGRRYLELRQRWPLELPEDFDVGARAARALRGLREGAAGDPEGLSHGDPAQGPRRGAQGAGQERAQLRSDGRPQGLHRLFAVNKQGLGSPCLPLSMLRDDPAASGGTHGHARDLLPDGKRIACVMSFRLP